MKNSFLSLYVFHEVGEAHVKLERGRQPSLFFEVLQRFVAFLDTFRQSSTAVEENRQELRAEGGVYYDNPKE